MALWFTSISSIMAEEKPYNWQPIFGYKHLTKKIFYDKNNTYKEIIEQTEFGIGSILVFDSKNSEVIIHGKKIVFRSMIRYLMIDCSTGTMMPMFDYFYNKEFPLQEDQPIAALKYESISGNYILLNKTSLIYLTMCPIQV